MKNEFSKSHIQKIINRHLNAAQRESIDDMVNPKLMGMINASHSRSEAFTAIKMILSFKTSLLFNSITIVNNMRDIRSIFLHPVPQLLPILTTLQDASAFAATKKAVICYVLGLINNKLMALSPNSITESGLLKQQKSFIQTSLAIRETSFTIPFPFWQTRNNTSTLVCEDPYKHNDDPLGLGYKA